jgi:hypothetical protein
MNRDGKGRYPAVVNLLALLLHFEYFATNAKKVFPHKPISCTGSSNGSCPRLSSQRDKVVKDLYNNVGHRTHPLFRQFSSAFA